jgi:hypothetical protein
MPVINVSMNGNTTDMPTVNVADTQKTFLDALRSTLITKKIMSDNDEFLTPKGGVIDDDAEKKTEVAEIFDTANKMIKLRTKQSTEGETTITVKKAGKSSSPHKFDASKSLDEFRTFLAARTPKAIEDSDRFQFKDQADTTINKADEDQFKVAETMDKNSIALVPASPTREITVSKGENTKRRYTVEESEVLANFKAKRLIPEGMMDDSDVFVVGTGDLSPADESTTTIKKAVPTPANILAIKYTPAESIFGKTVPKVESKAPPIKDWAHTISYGTLPTDLPVPVKFSPSTTLKAGVSGADEKWDDLSTEYKRYVVSRNQLGKSIAILPDADQDVVKRADYYAVWLVPKLRQGKQEPGATAPGVRMRSSFMSTYSQAINQMRKRGATTASASLGAKGIAMKTEFTSAQEETRETDRSTLYTTQLVYAPRIQLFFTEDEDIVPTDEFTHAIEEAVTQNVPNDPKPTKTRYIEILKELKKYGHFIPLRFDIGGACAIEEQRVIEKSAAIDEPSMSFSAGVEAEVKGVQAGISGGKSDSLKNSLTKLDSMKSVTYTVLGGDTGTASPENPSPWLTSLRSSQNWGLINYSDLVPTIIFLGPNLLRECLGLIKLHWADEDTRFYTALNMLEYATIAEARLMAADIKTKDKEHNLY